MRGAAVDSIPGPSGVGARRLALAAELQARGGYRIWFVCPLTPGGEPVLQEIDRLIYVSEDARASFLRVSVPAWKLRLVRNGLPSPGRGP